MPMPVGSEIKDSALFAPLSYHQLSVPVVLMPRALNAESVQAGSQFLQGLRSATNAFWPSHSNRRTRLLIGLQATPKEHIASMKWAFSTESRFWSSYRESRPRMREEWVDHKMARRLDRFPKA
jgi:hypothetical protein